jgi:hypothetical protein
MMRASSSGNLRPRVGRRAALPALVACLLLLVRPVAAPAAPAAGAQLARAPAPAAAPSSGPGLKLLFYGNSITSMGVDFQSIPTMVARLAQLAGHPAPLVVTRVAGRSLTGHLADLAAHPEASVAHPALGDGLWDTVIIQGESIEATHLFDQAIFPANALALYRQVREHPSGRGAAARAVLFDTWAATWTHPSYPSEWPGPPAMAAEIRSGYRAAQREIDGWPQGAPAVYAGVGEAFELAGFRREFYAADLAHAAGDGCHLAAMRLYGAIYGAQAGGIPYAAAERAGYTRMGEQRWRQLAAWADGGAEPPATPTPTPTPTRSGMAGDGMLGYWPLDEAPGQDRRDAHTGAYPMAEHAVAGGPAAVARGPGLVYPFASQWQGSQEGGVLRVPRSPLPSRDRAWTLAVWVRPRSWPTGSTWGQPGFMRTILNDQGHDNGRVLSIAPGPRITLQYAAGGGQAITVRSAVLPPDALGRWMLLLAWFDPEADRLYLALDDGPPAGQARAWPWGSALARAGLTLGNDPAGAPYPFDGEIGPLMAWDRVLAPAERAFLWNGGAGRILEALLPPTHTPTLAPTASATPTVTATPTATRTAMATPTATATRPGAPAPVERLRLPLIRSG